MPTIQTNATGTRNIEVTEQHLRTLEQYQLLNNLVDSNGIIDDSVVDKLRFNIRSLLGSDQVNDKALLDLCLDVIYHANMKALGLQNLIKLYDQWILSQQPTPNTQQD